MFTAIGDYEPIGDRDELLFSCHKGHIANISFEIWLISHKNCSGCQQVIADLSSIDIVKYCFSTLCIIQDDQITVTLADIHQRHLLRSPFLLALLLNSFWRIHLYGFTLLVELLIVSFLLFEGIHVREASLIGDNILRLFLRHKCIFI